MIAVMVVVMIVMVMVMVEVVMIVMVVVMAAVVVRDRPVGQDEGRADMLEGGAIGLVVP